MKCDCENRLKVLRGVELPQSKLTDDDVRAIRRRHERKQQLIQRLHDTHGAPALAREYGVHERTIEKVLSYETWRHVR